MGTAGSAGTSADSESGLASSAGAADLVPEVGAFDRAIGDFQAQVAGRAAQPGGGVGAAGLAADRAGAAPAEAPGVEHRTEQRAEIDAREVLVELQPRRLAAGVDPQVAAIAAT